MISSQPFVAREKRQNIFHIISEERGQIQLPTYSQEKKTYSEKERKKKMP